MKTQAASMGRQQGLSLVELMVSIAVGLLIVLFVSTMFVSSRGNQRVQDDNMRIQQDAQMVMQLMGKNIMQAGFGNFTWQKGTDFEGNGFMACDKGFVDPKSSTDSPECASKGGEQVGFQVRYRVDAYASNTAVGADCNGQDAKGTAMNRFYLSTKKGETRATLYCNGNGNFNFPQPLLENVEDLRLTYGVDNSGDKSVDQFLDMAAGISDWKTVMSVNVCLQVASDNNVAPEAQTYVDCTGTAKVAGDRRVRVVLNRLYTLRNNVISK